MYGVKEFVNNLAEQTILSFANIIKLNPIMCLNSIGKLNVLLRKNTQVLSSTYILAFLTLIVPHMPPSISLYKLL